MEQTVGRFFQPMIKRMMIIAGVYCLTETSIPILIHRLDVLRPDLVESFTNEAKAFCFKETLQEAMVAMIGCYVCNESGRLSSPYILTDRKLANKLFVKLGSKPCSKGEVQTIDSECIRLLKENKGRAI